MNNIPNLSGLRGIELLALRIQRPELAQQINAELAKRTFGSVRRLAARKSVRYAA